MSPYEKIDVHSHFVPPRWREDSVATGHEFPDGMPGIPPWSEESHLHMMKSINATKSILSITSPGVHLKHGDDEFNRNVARYCNEYAAELKKRRPEQFGFWAALPLPDVPGSLAEIAHAFDQLDANGVSVETNHHGKYLGHKDFDPVFAELNRRKATVFIHPTTPCLPSGEAAVPIADFPRPMFEFLFDTARAVINLFLSGTVYRCPDITFIIPHVGGTFPPLINRFSSISSLLRLPNADPNVNPAWVKETLNKQFYFDTAGWAFPDQIKGLLPYVSVERILYGSDFPYTPLPAVVVLSQDHDKYLAEVFPDEKDQKALCKNNAVKLLSKEPIRH